ncbi:MAG: cob(I)yrinic acid a,c-diamide adenosyltransferase [Bacteroidia bacterium]|nr:cob(I)yrinic acid a,c-diamide adenosyltransferase [Bacteroidia bacterium]
MKIYTKTGDKGTTSLIGGKRVQKFHERIEAYGTVDELISHVGLLRDQISDNNIKENLLFIQDRLMTCATILATDCDGCNLKLPILIEADIEKLESEIDEMEKQLEPLHSFILPGGHPLVSQAHICRTVCRRAERHTLALSQNHKVDELVIKFLNRLSDYLFVFARYISKLQNAKEIPWNPKY